MYSIDVMIGRDVVDHMIAVDYSFALNFATKLKNAGLRARVLPATNFNGSVVTPDNSKDMLELLVLTWT